MLNDLYHAIDPVAISFGPLSIRWYGLAYLFGFILAGIIINKTSKRWGLSLTLEHILCIVSCAAIGILIGGRLGYILVYTNGAWFSNPFVIFQVWNGGMSFHGGLVGCLVFGAIGAKVIGLPYLEILDLGAVAAPVGLFFGRCANFINGELWGAETDVPWGVVFGGLAGDIPRHPSQLYEAALEGLVLFLILYIMSRKNPKFKDGTYIGVFLACYGVFRFLIEFVRQPDVQIGYLAGTNWLTMGQVLSAPLVIAGIILIIYVNFFKKEEKDEEE